MPKIAIWTFTLALCGSLSSCQHYEVNGDQVYYTYVNEGAGHNRRVVDSAHARSFVELPYPAYGKDDRHVYYQGRVLREADPASFVAIGAFFGKDHNAGFYAGQMIRTARGNGFKRLGGNYSADDRDVFYMTEPLHVCSVTRFRIRAENHGWWAQDGCGYFFEGKRVPAADPQTFQILGDTPFAKDRRHVFFGARRLDYDRRGRRRVDTLDAASFQPVNYFVGRDKFGCIDSQKGRVPCRN